MKTIVSLFAAASLFIGIWVLTGCKKEEPEPIYSPIVTTSSLSDITSNSVVVKGKINSDGGSVVTSCGFCWSTSHNPIINDNVIFAQTGSDIFSSVITGLTSDTDYYVRSFAKNSAGVAYGNEIAFTSFQLGSDVDVSTLSLLSFSSDAAAVQGTIYSSQNGLKLIQYGVCWNTSGNPTASDNKTIHTYFSAGDFVSYITGLTQGTRYFVRTYAVFDDGSIVYGNEITFTTFPGNLTEFPGRGRYDAVGFSIDNKVYMGFGIDDSDFSARDFYEFDTSTKLWNQVTTSPGPVGGADCGFSIGNKGYVINTSSYDQGFLINAFWEYDPENNIWTQKASLPTQPSRASAFAFSIGTKGYIGIGIKEIYNGLPHEYYGDFWEWDQATDVWTKKADFPGNARMEAVSFAIGNKGYIGTGRNGTDFTDEFWEWDQATNVWTKKAAYAGGPRSAAVGFSIGTRGYIGTGWNGTSLKEDFWEWNQTNNTWTKVSNSPRGPRSYAFGISFGDKAYIGTGGDMITPYLNDFWEYDPNN